MDLMQIHPGIPEAFGEELRKICDDDRDSSRPSRELREFLIAQLQQQPCETTTLINYAGINLGELCLDDLENIENGNALYFLLNRCPDPLDAIFPRIQELQAVGKLDQRSTCFSLLARNDLHAIRSYANGFGLKKPSLDLTDTLSVYNHCITEQEIWLKEVFRQQELADQLPQYADEIKLSKALTCTQNVELDVVSFDKAIQDADAVPTDDDFVRFYLKQCREASQVARFVRKHSADAPEFPSLLEVVASHSCLGVLDKHVDLSNHQVWDDVLELLPDGDVFRSFAVLCRAHDCVAAPTEEIDLRIPKAYFSQISQLPRQLDVVECLLGLLFLRQNGRFVCSKGRLRQMLEFVRSCCDLVQNELFKEKRNLEKEQPERSRLGVVSKNLTDAFWRYELLNGDEGSRDRGVDFVSRMLSSPESLVALCLEKDDYEKARQVVKVFCLEKSALDQKIVFAKKLKMFRNDLAKKRIHFDYESIDNFFRQVNPERPNGLVHLDTETFLNVFDVVLVSQQPTKPLTDIIGALTKNEDTIVSAYPELSAFFREITQIFHNSNNTLSLADMLLDSGCELKMESAKKRDEFQQKFVQAYSGFVTSEAQKTGSVLDLDHSSHDAFMKLSEVCSNSDVNYLQRVFKYLKLISQLNHLDRNLSREVCLHANNSYFAYLTKNRYDMVGKLIFELGVSPKDLEEFFGMAKLDLVHHISYCCFPKVLMQSRIPGNDPDISSNEQFRSYLTNYKTGDEPTKLLSYQPDDSLLNYIEKRHWQLAYILDGVHCVGKYKGDTERTRCLDNCLRLISLNPCTQLFGNNPMLYMLSVHNAKNVLFKYLTAFPEGGDAFWKQAKDILSGLPENVLAKNPILVQVQDLALSSLAKGELYDYAKRIKSNRLRLKCFFDNKFSWPGRFCIDFLRNELTLIDGHNAADLEDCQTWLDKIEIYENIRDCCDAESWTEIYQTSMEDPLQILDVLIMSRNVSLLLNWLEMHPVLGRDDSFERLSVDYFLEIFEKTRNLDLVARLLDLLPHEGARTLCRSLCVSLRNVRRIRYLTDYISARFPDPTLKEAEIGCHMLSFLSPSDGDMVWSIVDKPLLIVEQLLMNTKLEKLAQVLDAVRPDLDETQLSKIDNLLRAYAGKSLDFRVIIQPAVPKPMDAKLLQSLDSISFETDRPIFVMPERPPNKSEWVQNHEAMDCMCCFAVRFSMFNRRHHCRRCGRVICWGCSMHRMNVSSYGDIPVRVCKDCYAQTALRQQQDLSASPAREAGFPLKSPSEPWSLSDDPEHNRIVREEFSYEHAPSVSLCLSILKLHSKSVEYSKFLLDHCNVMLKLLQPTPNAVIHEIDYGLVTQMLKSLALAAKMISYECGEHGNVNLCERMVGLADLLKLLNERGCLRLLPQPTFGQGQSQFIDAAALRKLRDKLLEEEQWSLALEFCTKAGLDKTGVLVAWGKTSLKAGCLQTAREKFHYCLEKVVMQEPLYDAVSLDESLDKRHASKASNLSMVSELKPSRTPPLVDEIIAILETKTEKIHTDVLKKCDSNKMYASSASLNKVAGGNEQAVSILNKLANLKKKKKAEDARRGEKEGASAQGTRLDPIFYRECVYYLSRYGSHLSMIQFYLRRGEMSEALTYFVENRLSSETFIEIYMSCLKNGTVDLLEQTMSEMDPSLIIWNENLKNLCRFMEKSSMYNCLYQLQLFMCDFVRAAITCVIFYKENVTNFSELASQVDHLHTAQAHLKQELEQEQWVQVTPVRKSSTDSKESSPEKTSLVMKMESRNLDRHINTIWRQIEVTKFLAQCEQSGRRTLDVLPVLFPATEDDAPSTKTVPTLFGTQTEKIQLAVLAIISGANVSEGFGIAFRIIQDHQLKPSKICCLAARHFAMQQKESSVLELHSSVRSSGLDGAVMSEVCDEFLISAIRSLTENNVPWARIESLVKLITDVGSKISAYIESKQLKFAYLLAVKHNRNLDIKRIMREAENLNQPHIKSICMKRLAQVKQSGSQ